MLYFCPISLGGVNLDCLNTKNHNNLSTLTQLVLFEQFFEVRDLEINNLSID